MSQGTLANNGYTATIALTVGKTVITKSDIESRVSLILFLSKEENTEENKRKIEYRAQEMLIREAAIINEARDRLKKTGMISDQEVNEYVTHIAKENGLSLDAFEKMLVDAAKAECAGHVNLLASFRGQIRAQIAKEKLSVHAPIHITDEEAAENFRQYIKQGGKTYDIQEIVLRFENPNEKERVKKEANAILERLQSGIKFEILAQQYSHSLSASKGGALGYVPLSHFDVGTQKQIVSMKMKTPTLIETANTFTIYTIKNSGQNKNHIQKAVGFLVAILPLPEGDGADLIIHATIGRFKAVKSQQEFEDHAHEHGCQIHHVPPRILQEIEPEPLRSMLSQSSLNKVVGPLETPDGIQLLFINHKEDIEQKQLTQDDFKKMLIHKKRSEYMAAHMNRILSMTLIQKKLD